jgi:hypothetical protein
MRINAYTAERYVIACKSASIGVKLFQIAFAKSDASMFVTFPYYSDGLGRLGIVKLNPSMTYPTDLTVGESFPVTAHNVKYTHHPSGQAHFSLSGKVRTIIKKTSTKLQNSSGHIFTILIQGIEFFETLKSTDQGKLKRGVVPFSLNINSTKAVKFVAHWYSQSELAKRGNFSDNSPWFKSITPNGETSIAIALTTPYVHNEEPYFLLLSFYEIARITEDQEVFFSFLGGFDLPDVVFDHSVESSLLMCIYPAYGDFEQLAREFGSIDL